MLYDKNAYGITPEQKKCYRYWGIEGRLFRFQQTEWRRGNDWRFGGSGTYVIENIDNADERPSLSSFAGELVDGIVFPRKSKDWFVEVGSMGGGDYTGCVVTKCNRQSFLKDVDEECAKRGRKREWYGVYEITGDYGYRGVYLRVKMAHRWFIWIDGLRAISQSCIYNEDALSYLEEEMKAEQWGDSLRREIEQFYSLHYDADFDGVDPDVFYSWFCQTADSNGQWHAEGGGEDNMYIDWTAEIAEFTGSWVGMDKFDKKKWVPKHTKEQLAEALPGIKFHDGEDNG